MKEWWPMLTWFCGMVLMWPKWNNEKTWAIGALVMLSGFLFVILFSIRRHDAQKGWKDETLRRCNEARKELIRQSEGLKQIAPCSQMMFSEYQESLESLLKTCDDLVAYIGREKEMVFRK